MEPPLTNEENENASTQFISVKPTRFSHYSLIIIFKRNDNKVIDVLPSSYTSAQLFELTVYISKDKRPHKSTAT
jgi:hypothetical protein